MGRTSSRASPASSPAVCEDRSRKREPPVAGRCERSNERVDFGGADTHLHRANTPHTHSHTDTSCGRVNCELGRVWCPMKHTKVKAQPRNNTPHGKVRRGLRSNTVVKASQSGLRESGGSGLDGPTPNAIRACGVYQRGAVSPYSTAGNRRDETASIAIVEMTDVHCRCANSNPASGVFRPPIAPQAPIPIKLPIAFDRSTSPFSPGIGWGELVLRVVGVCVLRYHQ